MLLQRLVKFAARRFPEFDGCDFVKYPIRIALDADSEPALVLDSIVAPIPDHAVCDFVEFRDYSQRY